MDIAKLGFVVETGPVKRAARDLDGLTAAAERTGNATTRVRDQFGRFVRQTDGISGSTGRARDEFGRFIRQTDGLGDATNRATKAGQGLSFGMAGLRRAAFVAAGAMAAITGVFASGALIRTSDQYVEMTNSLRVLGFTAEDAAAKLSEIGEIARRTRTPLGATAQLYQRVSIASRELGASQEDVMRFTETVGLALAQQGGSAEAASGALMQLSQALAGSVVRAEEFNSILEGAYPIAQAAANGIDRAGGSVGRLRQLMLAGEVSSKEFFTAILSQTTQLSAAFAGTVPTVGQAMQVLRDQWTLAVGQMSGSTSALATGILRMADGVQIAATFIAENMNQIIGTVSAAAAAFTAYMMPAIVSTTAAIYAQVAAWVTLRGAIAATGLGAVVILAGYLIGKFLDLVEATGSFGNALQAVGQYASTVFDLMQRHVSLLAEAFGAAASYMQGVFLQAFASIARGFSTLMNAIAAGLAAIGVNSGLGGVGSEFAENITTDADNKIKASTEILKSVGASAAAMNKEAVANLNNLANRLTAAKGVAQAAAGSVGGAAGIPAFGGVGGGGGGGGGKGGGGGAAAKSDTQIAAEKATEALEKLREEHARLQATIGMTETQERAYRAAMDLGTGATAAQKAEVMALVPEMARLEEAQRAIRERATAIKDGFRELFTGVVSGAKKAGDAIKDLASRMAELALNRLFEQLWNGFGFGGGVRGFDGLSGALRGAIGLASGGHVTRGGWAMVGERGPELVNLPAKSTVYDSRQTRNAGGGPVNVNVTVENNVQGASVRTVPTANGLRVIVEEMMQATVASGKLDRPMGQRFGMRPRPMGA